MATTGNDQLKNTTGRDTSRSAGGRVDRRKPDTEDEVTDASEENREDEREDEDSEEGRASGGAVAAARPAPREGAGMFEVYRPGQGGRVRWGTAGAAGLLLIWGAFFVNERMEALGSGPTVQVLKVAVPLILALGIGFYLFRLLTRSRRVVDFLIATEGEMKKVNWSTQEQVIGSTVVVISVMVFLAVLLFLVVRTGHQ